jgi:hypothetical protein
LWPKGASENASRRDGAIVAWHEVPGDSATQKSRPVGYGLIRAGVRTESMIGVTKFRICKLEQKHGAQVGEKYLWDSLRPIIPYPTGRFFRGTFPGTSCQATIVLSLRDTALSAEMSKLQGKAGRLTYVGKPSRLAALNGER